MVQARLSSPCVTRDRRASRTRATAITGHLVRFPDHGENEDQFGCGAARRAAAGRRRAAPPAARTGASRGDPLGAARGGQRRAVDARPRDPAGPVAGRGRRGLRAARRRGLPDEPAGRHDPHRRGRRRLDPDDHPTSSDLREHPLRLRLRPSRRFAIPASRMAAVDAAGPDRGAERAARLSRPARRRRAPGGARRLPQPRARHVRRCRASCRQQRVRAGGGARHACASRRGARGGSRSRIPACTTTSGALRACSG